MHTTIKSRRSKQRHDGSCSSSNDEDSSSSGGSEAPVFKRVRPKIVNKNADKLASSSVSATASSSPVAQSESSIETAKHRQTTQPSRYQTNVHHQPSPDPLNKSKKSQPRTPTGWTLAPPSTGRTKRARTQVQDTDGGENGWGHSHSHLNSQLAGTPTGRRSSWACSSCTFINEDYSATQCEVCAKVRKGREGNPIRLRSAAAGSPTHSHSVSRSSSSRRASAHAHASASPPPPTSSSFASAVSSREKDTRHLSAFSAVKSHKRSIMKSISQQPTRGEQQHEHESRETMSEVMGRLVSHTTTQDEIGDDHFESSEEDNNPAAIVSTLQKSKADSHRRKKIATRSPVSLAGRSEKSTNGWRRADATTPSQTSTPASVTATSAVGVAKLAVLAAAHTDIADDSSDSDIEILQVIKAPKPSFTDSTTSFNSTNESRQHQGIKRSRDSDVKQKQKQKSQQRNDAVQVERPMTDWLAVANGSGVGGGGSSAERISDGGRQRNSRRVRVGSHNMQAPVTGVLDVGGDSIGSADDHGGQTDDDFAVDMFTSSSSYVSRSVIAPATRGSPHYDIDDANDQLEQRKAINLQQDEEQLLFGLGVVQKQQARVDSSRVKTHKHSNKQKANKEALRIGSRGRNKQGEEQRVEQHNNQKSRPMEVEMWVERFRPLSVADLLATLSKPKIQSVCEWFESALDLDMGHDWTTAAARKKAITEANNNKSTSNLNGYSGYSESYNRSSNRVIGGGTQAQQYEKPRPRILLLHGPSGVGKTSTLSVIASEAQVGIREWQADVLPPNTSAGQWVDDGSNSDTGGGGGRRRNQGRNLSEVHVRFTSQLSDFEKFVRQGRYGSVLQTTTKNVTRSGDSNIKNKNNKQLLLVDNLPYLHGPDAVERFQKAVLGAADDFARAEALNCARALKREGEGGESSSSSSSRGNDTALAITFTCETESSNPAELRDMFSDALLNHPMVQVVDLKIVTDVRVRAALHRISALAGVEEDMPPKLIEEAVVGSGGDLRHAIHLLQFAAIGCRRQHNDDSSDAGGEDSNSDSDGNSDGDFASFDNSNNESNRKGIVRRNLKFEIGGKGKKNNNYRKTKGKSAVKKKMKALRKFPKTKSAPSVGSGGAVKSRHLLGIGRDPMLSMTHAVGRVLRAKRTKDEQQPNTSSASFIATTSTGDNVTLPVPEDFECSYVDTDDILALTTTNAANQIFPRPFSYHASTRQHQWKQDRLRSASCRSCSSSISYGAAKSPNMKGQLTFVPEQVVAECPLPPVAFAAFIQHNAVEFFSDLFDIGAAFDMLSVTDVLHGMGAKLNCFGASSTGGHASTDVKAMTATSGLFPHAYVTSLSAWTPAVFNHHSTPQRFRPIKKPPALGLHQRQRKAGTDNRRFVNMAVPGEEGVRAGVWSQAQVALERPALDLIARGSFPHCHGGGGSVNGVAGDAASVGSIGGLGTRAECEEEIDEFGD